MFDALNKGFRAARNRLAGVAEITEENTEQALRDVRLSLLEADVEFNVTKRFLDRVKNRVVGEIIKTAATIKGKKVKIGPAEQFVKVCQEELERLMASEGPSIEFVPHPGLTTVMMVGLQGSGKTTTAAKLANLLQKEGRRPLLAAADVQRPGAQEQLKVLGEKIQVPVFGIPGGRPIDICRQAAGYARQIKCDTIILDTAGRLAIDQTLMEELLDIKLRIKPTNIFLVIDAMIGQDAVKTSAAFNDLLSITGVILTKLDGDARGGAALSIREVTGAPIKYAGMGEAIDALERFRADGMASRILGFGDVVGLMKDFEEIIDEEKAEKDARKMLAGRFTFDDFLEQISMMQQLGPLQNVFEKLPFFADSVPEGFQIDDRELDRIKAMVNSMSKAERRKAELFKQQPNRIKRVATGSGRSEQEVNSLLQRFDFMQKMMSQIGQQASLLQKIPGMRQIAMARKLKDAIKTGGLEGNPMLANLTGDLLEAAVVGNAKEPHHTRSTKDDFVRQNRRKSKRKLQKKARKKSRK
ncbi:MAG: signal recognition particle protein [Deltaproteobacteria bacterium]|nr:signal recognition particle protein [Deltaproteobacteria bacterium]